MKRKLSNDKTITSRLFTKRKKIKRFFNNFCKINQIIKSRRVLIIKSLRTVHPLGETF